MNTPPRLARLAQLGSSLPTAMAIALAGCASGPEFQRPPPSAATTYSATAMPNATVASAGALGASQTLVIAPVPEQWWTAFDSDKLTSLIALAHANSPTLAAAQATLRQAQYSFQRTRIALLELQARRIANTVALYQAMGVSQLQ